MRAVRSEKEEELTFFDERDCVGGKIALPGEEVRIDSPDNFSWFFFFPLCLFLSFFRSDGTKGEMKKS